MQNQSHFFKEGITKNMITPAGPDHAQIGAVSGILDYFDAVYDHHFKEPALPAQRNRAINGLFHAHEQILLHRLMDFLGSRDDLKIIGPMGSEDRAPTVSILPLNKKLEAVYATLTQHQLMLGMGNFYAVRPLNGHGCRIATRGDQNFLFALYHLGGNRSTDQWLKSGLIGVAVWIIL